MTTGGEGGMLLTNNRKLWELGWSFKDHDKSFEAVYGRSHPPGYRFVHESFGTYRAAVGDGASAVEEAAGYVEKRRRNAAYLSQEFARIPALRVVTPPDDVWHSYYKYDVYIRPEHLREGWERNRIQEAISAEGIPCMVGACSEIYWKSLFSIDAAASSASSGAGARRDQPHVQGSSHSVGNRSCRHMPGGIKGHAERFARLGGRGEIFFRI